MPSSRQARITRTAISPRFATSSRRKSVSSGLSGARPLWRARVHVVPAAPVAVDPLGVGLQTRAKLLIEGVLLGRARVLHVRLAAGEMDDEAGAPLLTVLPEHFGPEIADRALAPAVVPVL